MEPRPRHVVYLVMCALLVVIALWLLVKIVEAIWVPLLIIGLVVIGITVAGWILYRRTRRW